MFPLSPGGEDRGRGMMKRGHPRAPVGRPTGKPEEPQKQSRHPPQGGLKTLLTKIKEYGIEQGDRRRMFSCVASRRLKRLDQPPVIRPRVSLHCNRINSLSVLTFP